MDIKQRFKSLVRSLSLDEYAQLEQNLVDEGCRDPLVVWNDIILDGHNRYEICMRHRIPFETVPAPVYVRTEEDAEDWIDKNQLGRRNLSPDDFRMIVGRRYNRKKEAHGGDRRSEDISKGQNDPLKTTAEAIAVDHGISSRTVKRAGKFAEAVEKIQEEQPEKDAATVYQLAKQKTRKPEKSGQRPEAKTESLNLVNLKAFWNASKKRDRAEFIKWIAEYFSNYIKCGSGG